MTNDASAVGSGSPSVVFGDAMMMTVTIAMREEDEVIATNCVRGG